MPPVFDPKQQASCMLPIAARTKGLIVSRDQFGDLYDLKRDWDHVINYQLMPQFFQSPEWMDWLSFPWE